MLRHTVIKPLYFYLISEQEFTSHLLRCRKNGIPDGTSNGLTLNEGILLSTKDKSSIVSKMNLRDASDQ